eukprot:1142995-Pelagomonas_calceolata.AAC.1
MSGKAQLNQRSDGVVIIDSACHIQYHLRVEMGGSPLDRADKYGIRTALMPGKGASTIGKSPVRVVSSNVFRDYNALLLELFSKASIHGNKELAMCTFAQGFTAGIEGNAWATAGGGTAVLVGLAILRTSLTSLNNWAWTTNVPLNFLANFMPILFSMPTSLLPQGAVRDKNTFYSPRALLTDWCQEANKIPDTQFGFYPGHNTLQPLFILRHLQHAARNVRPNDS